VHIAHDAYAATIGDDATIGRFGLVHACTIGDGVVVAEAATVMDGAVVGAHALIAPGALVPPRRQLPGGFVYAGAPAVRVREITVAELADIARAMRGGASSSPSAHDLPPLDMTPFAGTAEPERSLHRSHGASPRADRAFVAPTAVLVGDVRVGVDAGIYYSCVLAAGGARIVVGDRANVQDNSLIVTDAARGDAVIGSEVTIGHNVRMGSGSFGDRSLIGMASVVGDGVVVEPGGCIAAGSHVAAGTRVKAGWIWAGRPACALREVGERELAMFASAVDIYIVYGAAYRRTASSPS
jgi:carbonic anhydrase/acetyltransferase-like protein (isoleucine patch superfamily)